MKAIKKREETRIAYYTDCPICKKEIKGTSASHVNYNLKLHIEKCEKELKKEMEE